MTRTVRRGGIWLAAALLAGLIPAAPALASGAGCGGSGAVTTTNGQLPDGAAYKIQCPAGAWNGTLFLYSHGYVTPGSANPAQDAGDPVVGAHAHPVHPPQVDHESLAQGTSGPVVASCPHRQRNIAVPRSPNRQLHVRRRPTIDHGEWQGADLLCPDPRCPGVAVATRETDPSRQMPAEVPQRSLDHFLHRSLLPSCAARPHRVRQEM